jgi:TBC domain-containing protein kinase-like protein
MLSFKNIKLGFARPSFQNYFFVLTLKKLFFIKGNIKLSNFGLFHMTEYGYCVDFPIVNQVTLAPECYTLDFAYDRKYSDHHSVINNNDVINVELNSHPKSDVWSFGVILFQFLFGLSAQTDASSKKLNELLSTERILTEMTQTIRRAHGEKELDTQGSIGYEFLLKLYEVSEERRVFVERRFKPVFTQLVRKCLIVDTEKRPDFAHLLDFFVKSSDIKSNNFIKARMEEAESDVTNETDSEECVDAVKWRILGSKIRSSYLKYEQSVDAQPLINLSNDLESEDENEEDHLWRRGVNEVYYLWRLAGGDFLQVLKQNGRPKTKLTSIHKISTFTRVEDGYEYGKPVNDEVVFDDNFVPLSLQPLRNHLSSLSSINIEAYYPIIDKEEGEETFSYQQQVSSDAVMRKKTISSSGAGNKAVSGTPNIEMDMIELTQKQPLNIRELDIEYQFHRMVKFTRYLCAYPFKKAELYKGMPSYFNYRKVALIEPGFNKKNSI